MKKLIKYRHKRRNWPNRVKIELSSPFRKTGHRRHAAEKQLVANVMPYYVRVSPVRAPRDVTHSLSPSVCPSPSAPTQEREGGPEQNSSSETELEGNEVEAFLREAPFSAPTSQSGFESHVPEECRLI